MKLLLLEDDTLLGSGLRDYLHAEGHAVAWARRLSELAPLLLRPHELWLLDWQLPDGSGLEWLRQRRASGDSTPALVLSARDLLRERIEGLDSGADDYLVKPFAVEELAARVRAFGRRPAMATVEGRWTRGDVAIDLAAHAAWRADQPVELTAREWAVLQALVPRAGRVVEHATLQRLVLGADAEPSSNVLEVHVSAIRRKLGRDLVRTVRGLGYQVGGAA